VTELRRRGGQRLLDKAFRHPPKTTAAVLDPARYLAGDPPAVAIKSGSPPRGWRRTISTTYGAGDLSDLTDNQDVTKEWRGGRLTLDAHGQRRRLRIWLAVKNPRPVVTALRKALPNGAAIAIQNAMVQSGPPPSGGVLVVINGNAA
jgi:hypothetical protein